MSSLAPVLGRQFFDNNGDPLSGGKIATYLAGTTTPVATYIDRDGITPNQNPVVLDSAGRCRIWLATGSFKFVISDADDVVLWTEDDIDVDESTGLPSLWVTHAVTDGQSAANLVGETLDLSLYSSVQYDVEILRGTTVISNGPIAMQKLSAAGRVVVGAAMAAEANGVSFTVIQVGSTTVWQLQAALDSGAGNGTIKMRRVLVPV